MAFNLGMKVYDNLAAGVSFYTPAGSGITWGDNWPGAVLNQSVTLKAFTVQPTLAWEIIPGLSVGAGAMISFGSVDLDKGLVTPESLNGLLSYAGNPYRFTDTPPPRWASTWALSGKSTAAGAWACRTAAACV